MIAAVTVACSFTSNDTLAERLSKFIEDKNADIGVAIITTSDTILINGNSLFPMMSIYKFPIALAVADKCRRDGISFSEMCEVHSSDIRFDTYSPMIKVYDNQKSTFTITLEDLLKYSLQLSDNNASDILLKWLGGAHVVRNYIHSLGYYDINICHTETELHDSIALCYQNSSTPLAMASLMNQFNNELSDVYSTQLQRIMAQCSTGQDRLPAPFSNTRDTIIHKTGTGFTLPDGRLMAINDTGYIKLKNGYSYSIAVFISNSQYNEAETVAIIANISKIVRDYYISTTI